MKKNIVIALGAVFFLLLGLSSSHGAECSGPWKKIPGYKQSMGAPCQALGLDTHRGTCQPGQAYETLCDDAAGGLYRTCPGPTPCGNVRSGRGECRQWDYVYNEPCPTGYENVDCQGHCERLSRRERDCTSWDFVYNRPCPAGYSNPDCRDSCEPVSFFNR